MKKLFLFLLLLFNQNISTGFNASSDSSGIYLIDSNASLKLEDSITDFSGTIFVKEHAAGALVDNGGGETITFAGGTLRTGDVTKLLTGTLDPLNSDTIKLGSGDSLDSNAGTIPQTVSINAGTTAEIIAKITGAPLFSSAIALGDQYSTLELGITSTLNQSITGAGKLKLIEDLRVASGKQIPAKVDQNGKILKLLGGTFSNAVAHQGGGTIILEGDTTVGAVWTISDDTTIDGNGHTLTLGITGALSLTGTKTLTLKNIKVETSIVDAISMAAGTDTLRLENMEFVSKTNGFTFGTGHLDIYGFVKLSGQAATGEPPLTTFEFSSAGNLTIAADATLFVDRTVKFKYDCTTKTQLVFFNSSSELFLNGCTFDSGTEGVGFSGGTMVIQDKVNFVISATAGKEAELATTMNVYFLAGSRLTPNNQLIWKPIPLKYGASINLKNTLYDRYIYVEESAVYQGDNNIRGTSFTGTNNNKLYLMKPNSRVLHFDSAGTAITHGDLVVFASQIICDATIAYFHLESNRNLFPPVSSPKPPFYVLITHGYYYFSTTYLGTSAQWYINKIGGSPGDPIVQGDTVYLQDRESSFSVCTGGYLMLTGQTYDPNSVDGGNAMEPATYSGGGLDGTPPVDNSHYWLIENVNNNGYLTHPGY